MKPGEPIPPELQQKVDRLDQCIDRAKSNISATEKQILNLIMLNDGRRVRMRAMGRKRSELMSYDLF